MPDVGCGAEDTAVNKMADGPTSGAESLAGGIDVNCGEKYGIATVTSAPKWRR